MVTGSSASASTELQVSPRPFVKWAGGKTQLLGELRKRIPPAWDPARHPYVEVFAGGGALFWALRPSVAAVNDSCEELVNVWAVVKDRVDDLVSHLSHLSLLYQSDPEGTYYGVRDGDYTEASSLGRAARTIFLNKSCFNGVYRVNREGKFNVAWGKNPRAAVCDELNLRACSERMRESSVYLTHQDFDSYMRDLAKNLSGRGVLAYLDPPYLPSSRTACFSTYTPGGFGRDKHLLLLGRACELRRAGFHVLVTQSDDEQLIEEYRKCGFRCERVEAVRRVSRRGSGRGPVGEYVIYGGPK